MFTESSTGLKGFFVKCPAEYRKEFKSSHVIYLVSVGQDYHEGEKLFAAINLINKKFAQCTIMVNDLLQRHTIALENNIDNTTASKLAIEEGDKWIQNNSQLLQLFKIPTSLHRWNQWINTSLFEECKNRIDILYEKNTSFREGMNNTIHEFLTRYKRRTNEIDQEKAFSLCLAYLKEETSVIVGMWKDFAYDFILYPGKQIEILRIAYKIFGVDNSCLRWLHLKFRRNNKKKFREYLK